MDTLQEVAEAEAKAETEATTETDQESQPDEELGADDQDTDQDEPQDSETEQVVDEEGSQPKKDDLTKGMQKRLAKEKSRQFALEAELEKERADNAALRQAQIDPQRPAVEPTVPQEPNPDDFDEGRDDKKFIAADRAFTRYQIKHEIVSEIQAENKQTTQSQQAADRNVLLKEASDEHYERAGNIKVDDYLAVEKRAINIIGRQVAEAIVMDFEATSELLYHLGENIDKAREVSRLFKDGKGVKGLRLLAQLEDEVRVKKKPKKFAPDPEGEEERGKVTSSSTNDWRKRGPKGATYK